jgi:four helix bundle protein
MNNEKIQFFTDLNAWKEGHALVSAVYKITKIFPKEEQYALIDQLRRAAISIVSNIAEGFSRESYREKIQFYAISRGSTTEIQSQLMIARDLGYISESQFEFLMVKTIVVHKLLSSLIKSSRSRI